MYQVQAFEDCMLSYVREIISLYFSSMQSFVGATNLLGSHFSYFATANLISSKGFIHFLHF